MMPNMGKRMAGSMAVMDRGITSVTQYVAIISNTKAHFASYSDKTQVVHHLYVNKNKSANHFDTKVQIQTIAAT